MRFSFELRDGTCAGIAARTAPLTVSLGSLGSTLNVLIQLFLDLVLLLLNRGSDGHDFVEVGSCIHEQS